MTTLNDTRVVSRTATGASVDVFGVPWPAYKVHALFAGALVAVVALLLGAPATLIVWISGAAALAIWWGERVFSARRWDDDPRDIHADQ